MLDYELPQRKYSNTGNLLIIGTGSNADIISYLFEESSNYKVVGYAKNAVTDTVFRNKPVYSLDTLETYYDPTKTENYIFVAIGNNSIRKRIYKDLKKRGYKFASFVSSKAILYPNVKIGENVFIFENNVVQYNCKIGDNTILWSGNHIGHESTIGNHCFISSHCVVSGYCNIGDLCFLGVNCTIVDNVNVESQSFIKAGSLVKRAKYENNSRN